MCSIYLITNPKLRAEHMNRVEVLDRVGGLLLLPNTELATTKQVAKFYGVDQTVIRQMVQRNREELEENGINVTKFAEFMRFLKVTTCHFIMSLNMELVNEELQSLLNELSY